MKKPFILNISLSIRQLFLFSILFSGFTSANTSNNVNEINKFSYAEIIGMPISKQLECVKKLTKETYCSLAVTQFNIQGKLSVRAGRVSHYRQKNKIPYSWNNNTMRLT